MTTGQTTLQRGGQALLDKLLAHPPNCRQTHLQSFTDLLIGPAWSFWTRIGFEQDPCMQQLARRCLAGRDHLL
jgi:hypothetical protein